MSVLFISDRNIISTLYEQEGKRRSRASEDCFFLKRKVSMIERIFLQSKDEKTGNMKKRQGNGVPNDDCFFE